MGAAGDARPGRLDGRLGPRSAAREPEGRIFGGHGGAMPGFLAGLHLEPRLQRRAPPCSRTPEPARPTGEIALELADADDRALAAGNEALAARRPAAAEVAAILGRWWSEGNETSSPGGREADGDGHRGAAAGQTVGLRAAPGRRLPGRLGPRARRAAAGTREGPSDLGRATRSPATRSRALGSVMRGLMSNQHRAAREGRSKVKS